MRRLFFGLLMLSAAVHGQAPSAHEVASGLARLGPRPDGAASQQRASRLLLEAMIRAGLQEVRAVPAPNHPEWVNLTGVLPGKSAREIVLSAHYDSTQPSPGAGDDASGCGVVIATAADLARTPLEHTVRVILFDAEEIGLKGSRAWVESLPPAQRDRILANLNVEMVGWAESKGPTIHAFPVEAGGDRVMAPGWLVHSILKSGEAVGWEYEVIDNRASLLSQLVLRTARVRLGADANSFQEKGIPALSVSDSALLAMDPAFHKPIDTAERLDPARMEKWTQAVSAAVRRLDRLAGRPRPEDEYLVLFGRVWLRRDIYWVGLALWILMLVRARPGRWTFRTKEESVREGRRYAPGFAFRWLFLLAVFLAPVLAILLFPAALIAAFPPKRIWARILLALTGLLPILIYAAALIGAILIGLASRKAGFEGGVAAGFLLPGAALAFLFLISAARRDFRPLPEASGSPNSSPAGENPAEPS